jgi:hypothetical protein
MGNLYFRIRLIIRGNSLIMKFKGRGNTTMEIRLIRVIGSIMKRVDMGA